MKSQIVNWIRDYATWIAIVIFVAALLALVATNSVLLPLLLICIAFGLLIFRYWEALNSFDMWALDEWIHARADTIGIREWTSPYRAADLFCAPDLVRARNEAAAKMNSIILDLVKVPSRNNASSSAAGLDGLSDQEGTTRARTDSTRQDTDYEAAQRKHEQSNSVLARDLHRQLASGALMAKGLPIKDGAPQSERVIPTSRWRILRLDVGKGEAYGRGLHYVGVVIGKKPKR